MRKAFNILYFFAACYGVRLMFARFVDMGRGDVGVLYLLGMSAIIINHFSRIFERDWSKKPKAKEGAK